MTKRARTFSELPMFASDEDIGEAVLGFERRKEFHGRAVLLEARGMPKVNPEWGGRCVPAVKAFLCRRYGLSTETPLAPDGKEGQWPKTQSRAHKPRASNGETERAVVPFRTGSPAPQQ